MDRLTKFEIQRALLAGREIAWTNAAGKREAIKLEDAAQRRLFDFLLQSTVREAKGLQDEFVAGLSKAYDETKDPAEDQAATSAAALTGPWRLQKIETEGFGGLNTWNGPAFVLEFEGESLIAQGPNGSGKSSLVGAILWAMAGERPRDYSTANAEDRAEVYDIESRKIGTWPPIACYPNNPLALAADPYVRVTLTFVDDFGTIAIVDRRLKDGAVSTTVDPMLNLPDVLIETGLLMPSRMPQIRFEKGQTALTQAVQSLTGLDDLVDIGALVDGLCHKGREYLSTHSKSFDQQKALFESALAEAERALKPADEVIQTFQPKDTEEAEGAFATLDKRLRKRATELTKVISEDLATGLDLASAQTQADVAGAISGAREDLSGGLSELTTWKLLSAVAAALRDETITTLEGAADEADTFLAEALQLDERSQRDTRLQLKALGAHWHEAHRGAQLTDCPLCDTPLKDEALKAEIESLRHTSTAATRKLNDNLNAIEARLNTAVPATLASRLRELAVLAPRKSLIADIEARFVNRPRFKNTLAAFAGLVTNVLGRVPLDELAPLEPSTGQLDAAQRLQAHIAAVRRLVLLEQWRRDYAPAWEDWWADAAGGTSSEAKEGPEPSEIAERRHETFTEHLMRLSNAISEAEPYRVAADALTKAWKFGREAHRLQKIQEEREAIVGKLAPLKTLGALADAQARLAIETLSEDIGVILRRIHLTERLAFKGAKLQRRAGLEVHAAFAEDFKIDATLVANTSWLRAVLWAFLFALRQEAIKQLGTEPLPLLLLDDPQSTFDAEHRHRWALEIVGLQTRSTPAQIILATHDEIFVELLKIDGVKGREAIIVSAGPELGHVGIFEGASLDRKWEETKSENTAVAGQNYIGAVRIYVEGLLRLMLRGYAADVNWAGCGFVMGTARDKIRELSDAKLAPWDKSEFKRLIGQLDPGISAIKHMEMAHHSGRVNLGMGEAQGVEEHWRKKLQSVLRRAFQLVRDHQLIHGGLRALHALEPDCELPEGYTDKIKTLRFPLLGRAAALTGGITADGRVDLDFSSERTIPIVLGRHFAFRLNAPTLEPVARKGDILLVKEIGEPSTRSLVVARYEDRVVARRFEIADNHSDIAVLTAQAVNPRQIAPPIVVKKATLELHKVIGVLFDGGQTSAVDEGEVCDCGGESFIHRYATEVKGLVEVVGNSAEPIALNGQMLLIGDAISASEALNRLDGRPVIAGDMADDRYFKRLRRGEGSTVVLESLEISGDFPPVVLTYGTGAITDLKEVWPVYGVLFEQF
ncbi:AAA family ATPase [Rhizobium laguerreae]|uniref:AAA family ATPase n=1 Tax=Rhizobium laguerreae TaxID=1076926 RepID=UPI001C9130F9|nr:AAA family ATPase [Rhizobium laguerreae]MBY3385067.1 AAA family ATPase [Rhizobium laguerreae]MBY3398728.1 AAA family ATPase [Rhizobium laguerreae]MBY3405666.1 AAA family ATPase [Rhizobium laguerreae]